MGGGVACVWFFIFCSHVESDEPQPRSNMMQPRILIAVCCLTKIAFIVTDCFRFWLLGFGVSEGSI